MYSFSWNLINSAPSYAGRLGIYAILVFGGVILSLPRAGEGWFKFVAITYPLIVIGALELIRRGIPYLLRIRENSLALLDSTEEKKALNEWWDKPNKREHIIWCFSIGVFLAGMSLVFTGNTQWSRYTDAIGIFYIGFIFGDVSRLLYRVPVGMSQLKKCHPKLNPINPACTISLQVLAEAAFTLGIGTGMSLLAINTIVATASYIYSHLSLGIYLLSLIAWVIITCLVVYPHFVLWELSKKRKQKTLKELERVIFEQYENVINGNKAHSTIEDTVKLFNQVQSSKSFPISYSGIFGTTTTLILNIVPMAIGFFR